VRHGQVRVEELQAGRLQALGDDSEQSMHQLEAECRFALAQ
jgi:hypothetical protein